MQTSKFYEEKNRAKLRTRKSLVMSLKSQFIIRTRLKVREKEKSEIFDASHTFLIYYVPNFPTSYDPGYVCNLEREQEQKRNQIKNVQCARNMRPLLVFI